MNSVADYRTSEQERDIIRALRRLRYGQTVAYFKGDVTLSKCSPRIVAEVQELYDKGRILLVQRRRLMPVAKGEIDWRHGVGSFDYLALGRA